MAWWGWAILASIGWGVHYTLIGRALTVISPITLFWLPVIPLTIFLPFYYNILISDAKSLYYSTIDVQLSSGLAMFTSIAASIALYRAISGSNASLASLIEITYPVFIIIFAAIIFNENYLSWSTALGGFFILLGASIVIYNN